MLKNILLSGLLCSSLMADSFDNFLQMAMEKSPYLASSALSLQQAKQQSSIITRYKNPSLELEYSRFEPDAGSSDGGFRASYNQPVRLWGVEDDYKRFSTSILQNENAFYIQKRASFIRDISILFTLYAEKKMLVNLGVEELEIAEKIYNISKTRYEVGTISQGVMLQSQVAFEMIQIHTENLSLEVTQKYYDLLKQAGITQEIHIDIEHDFVMQTASNDKQNPTLAILKSQKAKALSEEAVYSNKVEWMDVYAEYESEPEEEIARVGVNIPLAIFNTNAQEKQISRLEAKKTDLLIKNEDTQLSIESRRLKQQKEALFSLKDKNTNILKIELKLLEMFEEGYKIANINLLELQDVKNKVIQTKERIIEIKTALNQNAIYTNYIQGNYNE
ncbi:MAG: TolC family protein [Sulfurimonas sp.]|nr:TolC family protein [Sulfurimonas sp.]